MNIVSRQLDENHRHRNLHQALSFAIIITSKISIIIVQNVRHAAATRSWC